MNAFWRKNETDALAPGQAMVFLAIIDTANRAYWSEWFPCPLRNIAMKTRLTPSAVTKAKDVLVEKHYIDVRKKGKKIEMKITFRSIEDEEDSSEENTELLPENQSPKTIGILRVCKG